MLFLSDYEILSLVMNSGGLNLALDYLPGAFGFDAARTQDVSPELASMIVWLDAFIANVDRTARNTNLILWHRRLHLIDHGAALYYQHDWMKYPEQARNPFPQIKDHVLLDIASGIEAADRAARDLLQGDAIEKIVKLVPDDWFTSNPETADPAGARAVHQRFLEERLAASAVFVTEAVNGRHTHV